MSPRSENHNAHFDYNIKMPGTSPTNLGHTKLNHNLSHEYSEIDEDIMLDNKDSFEKSADKKVNKK